MTPPLGLDELGTTVALAAYCQLRFINDNAEQLLRAWFAETGLLPSESVLATQDTVDGTRMWVERRT